MKEKERTPEEEKIIEFFTNPEHRKLLRELIDMETEEDRRKIVEFEKQIVKNLGLPMPSYLKDGKYLKLFKTSRK